VQEFLSAMDWYSFSQKKEYT